MLMMLEEADGDQTLRTVFRFTLYSAQSHRRLDRKSRGGQQTVRLRQYQEHVEVDGVWQGSHQSLHQSGGRQ